MLDSTENIGGGERVQFTPLGGERQLYKEILSPPPCGQGTNHKGTTGVGSPYGTDAHRRLTTRKVSEIPSLKANEEGANI